MLALRGKEVLCLELVGLLKGLGGRHVVVLEEGRGIGRRVFLHLVVLGAWLIVEIVLICFGFLRLDEGLDWCFFLLRLCVCLGI